MVTRRRRFAASPRLAVRQSVAVAARCYALLPGAAVTPMPKRFEIERWGSGEPCNVYAVAVAAIGASARLELASALEL